MHQIAGRDVSDSSDQLNAKVKGFRPAQQAPLKSRSQSSAGEELLN